MRRMLQILGAALMGVGVFLTYYLGTGTWLTLVSLSLILLGAVMIKNAGDL